MILIRNPISCNTSKGSTKEANVIENMKTRKIKLYTSANTGYCKIYKKRFCLLKYPPFIYGKHYLCSKVKKDLRALTF